MRKIDHPKPDRKNDIADPWSVPVAVAQIPDTGLHRDIEASPDQNAALTAAAAVREITSARASLDVTPIGKGGFHVTGEVSARVGQTCVVTLDPIENDIVEQIDLMFVPDAQITELAASVDEEADADAPDPPEPIINGLIDLGRLATDALFLGIDPYPRKSDAVFDPPIVAPDPQDHPFAALKALRTPADPAEPKKPKSD